MWLNDYIPQPRRRGAGKYALLGRVAIVHAYVYIWAMKRKELERRLRDLGWTFQRHGGKHDVWKSPDGPFTEFVPRHAEINEKLAQAILRRAKERK